MSYRVDYSALSEGAPGAEVVNKHFSSPSMTEERADCERTSEPFCVDMSLKIEDYTSAESHVQVFRTDAGVATAVFRHDSAATVSNLSLAVESATAAQTDMTLSGSEYALSQGRKIESGAIPYDTEAIIGADVGTLIEVESEMLEESSAFDLSDTAESNDVTDSTNTTATNVTEVLHSEGSLNPSDPTFIVTSSSSVPIPIKCRKPRRKAEKPKVILLDSNQVYVPMQDVSTENLEPSAEGLKKKNALESLRQAQSLFKFVPRSSLGSESTSSLKVCKATKTPRQSAEFSSTEVLLFVETCRELAVQSLENPISGTDAAQPAMACADTVVSHPIVVEDIGLLEVSHEDGPLDHHSVVEKELKPKLKARSKVKEEKKKLVVKTEVQPSLLLAASSHLNVVLNGDNSSGSSSSSSVLPFVVTDTVLDSRVEAATDNPEKVKGKRKYTFQQPLLKKAAAVNGSARTNSADVIDVVIEHEKVKEKEKEKDIERTQASTASTTLLLRSDSVDADSISLVDTVAVPIDEEDAYPRMLVSYDDADFSDVATTKVLTRTEKKEPGKRPGRGESKECSMTDVPGRHLLGPKMLAFMQAFPEGDVIGNDDVETTSTQRQRLEGWLQQLKNDCSSSSSSSSSNANGLMCPQSNVSDDGDNKDPKWLGHDVVKIKTELLQGIQDKLIKAASCSGRGTGTSSLLLKPLTVQILLPYEIEILRARSAQQTMADDAALGSINSPHDVPRCGVQTAADEIFNSTRTHPRVKIPQCDPSSMSLACVGSSADLVEKVGGASSNDSEESEHDTSRHLVNESSNSGRELLCSILGVVDAKVRTSNQMAQIHDTVRVKNTVEDRRIKQFTGAGDVLSQRVAILHSKHTAAETSREQSQLEALSLISGMEAEERGLMDRLKRIRDEISHTKRYFVDHEESSKLARLSEKARIYFATREAKKCCEMLSVAERNKELLMKFKTYITALTSTYASRTEEANQKAKAPRLDSDGDRRTSKRGVPGSTDGENLMLKLSYWVEKTQMASPQTVLFSRLMYEGMRLSHHLLSKYAPNNGNNGKHSHRRIESENLEGKNKMDNFEKLFSMHDLYDNVAVRSIAPAGMVEDEDKVSECVSVVVDDMCRQVESDLPLIDGDLEETVVEVKKNVTVVLCDPRNLSHLVPRKMPERSIRIVKIMAKLTSLQVTLEEEKLLGVRNVDEGKTVYKGASNRDVPCDAMREGLAVMDPSERRYSGLLETVDLMPPGGSFDEALPDESSPRCDGDYYEGSTHRREHFVELEIRCLARDSGISLQDCFWESVALVHADEYIDHLRERARAASRFNPPYLPMKDHAIAGEAEAEVHFSSELNEDIPVEEADIRAAAEESGDPLPNAMLRRHARSSVRVGSSSSQTAHSNGHMNDEDSDNAGCTKGRQRSAATPSNRLSIPQNVADALLAFREEEWNQDFAPNDSDRVWMWDTMRCRRVGGYAAPFFKNLRDCLSRNSHFLVYTGQDEKEETPPIQWDIVQWLRQAVQPPVGGDFFVPSSGTKLERSASELQGEHEEERERLRVGGKRKKVIDESSSSLRAKFRDTASKLLVRGPKTSIPTKGKNALAVQNWHKKGTVALIASSEVPQDVSEGEPEVKHKINLGAFSAFRRISVWNTVRKVRVSGGNAPMKKDLKAFLEEKPEYVIWTGQRVAGAEIDGDRRRVASKAKIIKKISSKLGKPKIADSQKSRFSALSREAIPSTLNSVPSEKEKSDYGEGKVEKLEKIEKISLTKLSKEELLQCVTVPIRAKKEKKHFEASVFLPVPRRLGDRVRAKVLEDFDGEEGDTVRISDGEGDGEEEGRVSLWNTVKQCRVAGGNAPYRRDLQEYLLNRPEYCVYDGQEPLVPRMMKAERDALKGGRGRGRGRGGRGGRGRGGRGGVLSSLPPIEVKVDYISTAELAATSIMPIPSPVESVAEKTFPPPLSKVPSQTNIHVPKPLKSFSLVASESKKKAGKSSAQILEASMTSPIPLWNSRRKSCLSGRNAPSRSLLVKFLATRPEYEIYTGQDLRDNDDDELTRILALSIAGDDAPQLSYASERICMWDNVLLVKVEGEEAPMRCDLTAFIANNPFRDVYINQEEMLEAARTRNLDSDSDSDESSVKKTSKAGKAKGKAAQLTAYCQKEEAVLTAGAEELQGVDPAEETPVEDSSSSSSSQHTSSYSSTSISPYGDDEDESDTVRRVEGVPLKRGRKARAFKKNEMPFNSKQVKPLKKGHVSVWNTLRQCRVSGGNAPLRSQLAKFLATRPEYEVWVGQERHRKKKSPTDLGPEGGDEEGDDEAEPDVGVEAEVEVEVEADFEDEDEIEGVDDEMVVEDMCSLAHAHVPPIAPTSCAVHAPSSASISAMDSSLYDQPQSQLPPQTNQSLYLISEHTQAETLNLSPSTGRLSRKRAFSSSPLRDSMSRVRDPSSPSLSSNSPVRAPITLITVTSNLTLEPSSSMPAAEPEALYNPVKSETDIDTHQEPNILPESTESATQDPSGTVYADLVPSVQVSSVVISSAKRLSVEGGSVAHIAVSHVAAGGAASIAMNVLSSQDIYIGDIEVEAEAEAEAEAEDSRDSSIRPAIPEKGVLIMPSRAKRRRELANLDDSPSFTAFSSSTLQLEEEASDTESTGDSHRINGRSIVGDRFILHCGEGNVVSGPGWWEDLDAGASDTYISPCSFDAAVAAAAVVCAGVDAVTLGCVVGCDLLAAAKAHEDVEASPAEDQAASSTTSTNSPHVSQDSDPPSVVADTSSSLIESMECNTVAGSGEEAHESSEKALLVRVDASDPIEDIMGVEEMSDLMVGFLEECKTEGFCDCPTIAHSVQELQGRVELVSDANSSDTTHLVERRIIVLDRAGDAGTVSYDGGAAMEVCEGTSSTAQAGAETHQATGASSSISTNTRSKTGIIAAPGVLTSELLGTVAADTAVVLTEVQGVKNVFCCIRPPGHHAGRFGSTRGCANNGFCLLNNVAIGAYYARIKYGLRRFAVVDIDAHFGNGTAEIFEGDPHAFYSSVHLQYDGPKDFFFPSSSCCLLGAEERNPNRVLVNVYPPVRAGNPLSKSGKPRSRGGFRTSFEDVIIPALKAFNPDIIFISAGFDGASTDPIGGQLGLKPVDFHWMAEKIQVVADEVCGGRVVSVLEGGYDVSKAADGLATCAEAHVLALAGRNYR